MHVSTQNSPHARLRSLPLGQAAITAGFWAERQQVNRHTSLRHAFKKLEESGNFNNLRLAIGTGEGEYRRPMFMDSDIYKWLEAVGYALGTEPDPELEAMAHEAIDLIAAAQQPDGYINSYFQVVEPENRWLEIGTGHELYCAGHLFEAAVAFYRGTGQRRLLDISCRFADLIDATFGPGKADCAPGHPEIELALVELYRETDERRYLALADFFISQRGYNKMAGRIWFDKWYYQDRTPVRETTIVEGHAVRQLYLTAGIADVYLEKGEDSLLAALNHQWHDLTARKMHLTAGIGARHEGEAFGDAYELPSDRCYCETCAAIANMMWNWRMLLISGEARYAELLERSLYNGFLSGISLDGQRYFYVNPLMSPGGIERPEWYGCACCPPNVMRQIAMLPHYAATTAANGLQIHQYLPVNLQAQVNGSLVALTMATDYPRDGRVQIVVAETNGVPWQLALRIPSWSSQVELRLNGQPLSTSTQPGDYAHIERTWQVGDTVELNLSLQPRLTEPNPRVDAIRGSLAIEYGPLVYCLEAIDQPDGINLLDVQLDPTTPLLVAQRNDLLGGVVTIQTQGRRIDLDGWENTLYRPYGSSTLASQPVTLTAIPYYAWANRGPGAMRVWIPKA